MESWVYVDSLNNAFEGNFTYFIPNYSQEVPSFLIMGHLEAKELNCERLCFRIETPALTGLVMNVPTIADDVLHCSVFPSNDANAAVLATQISRCVEQWLPNHIWHRDSFQLVLSKEIEGTLECTMRVGDSVDDEWLVVWLLFQITKEFNVVARYAGLLSLFSQNNAFMEL
jgi:hypothetical protein